MLFERQRLLLTLLDVLGEPVGSTDFQKLLFLYTRECESTPSYEFVPYRFGSFSFTSYADKRYLTESNLLETDESWTLTAEGRKSVQKRAIDPLQVTQFCERYDGVRGDELIAQIYRRYPYYAIRSEIVERVLPDTESRKAVEKVRPSFDSPALLTIGYEGKCLEAYLNQLIQAGVTLLCDVRRNPLSRKYGFSKSTLSKTCEGVGIRYEHLPELGIASDQRRNLETQADYDALFEIYERESLPGQTKVLSRIEDWVEKETQRVALTCFERLPDQCHRHCVAEALAQTAGKQLAPIHL